MSTLTFKLLPFQDEFVFSEARFPLFCAGVGTGKSLCGILRMMRLMEESPNNLGLIIRREFTDLQKSTILDFERYTGLTVGTNKEVKLPNGSVILFLHGEELGQAVIKNINAGAIFVEQLDEFATDESFQFLRDRLRRQEAKFRTLFATANPAGHNYMWKNWKNKPPSKEYHLIEATTFDNADNLPQDFIKDLEAMQEEAPNHYQRYVLNSWEETSGDDYLFTWELLNISRNLKFPNISQKTIIGNDVARFGDDKTAFTAIRDTGNGRWEQFRCEGYEKKDTRWTFGRYVDMRRKIQAHFGVIDDDGIGGAVTDSCKEIGLDVVAFHANEKPKDEDMYVDKRAEGYFTLKDLIIDQLLKIIDDEEQMDELLTIRFKYKKGKRCIVSKDEMRKEGIKSPNKADALMMAVSAIHKAIVQDNLKSVTPAKQTPANAGIGFAGEGRSTNAGFGFRR